MRQLLSISLGLCLALTSACTLEGKNKDTTSQQKKKTFSVQVDKTQNDGQLVVKLPSLKTINTPAVFKDDAFIGISPKVGSNYSNRILHINLKTKQAKYVFTSKYEDASVQEIMVNERWVTWTDASADGTKFDIYAMNRKTDKVMKLSKGPSDLVKGRPYLYQDYVAWMQEAPDQSNVVRLYHLNTNELKDIEQIKSYSFLNSFVHMNENKLVYTDLRDEKTLYGIYDLQTGKKQWIPSGEQYLGHTKLTQNQLFSIKFSSLYSWGGQEFISYDLSTGKTSKHLIDSNEDKQHDDIRLFEVSSDGLYAATVGTDQLLQYKWKNGQLIKVEHSNVPEYFRASPEQPLVTVKDPIKLELIIETK